MLIKVKLLKGYSNSLFYKLPQSWQTSNLIGSIVKVPLRTRKVLAIIEDIAEEQNVNFELKFPFSIEEFPKDPSYLNFINKLSLYYQIEKTELIGRLQQFILKKDKKIKKVQHEFEANPKIKDILLTKEQQTVCDFLIPRIKESQYCSTLLHGVTGSGKTEVYKNLIDYTVLHQKKSVLFLLPEVSLAVQFEQIFKNTLKKEIKILSFHSAITESAKKELWKSLLHGEPILIIGVHLPILLPISNLGLILVDEEHEIGYQEKKHPKINSKEAAILKAQLNNIPILLGSATPCVTSLHNVQYKNWNFFQLKQRFSGSFCEVQIVQLNKNKQRKNFWISKELEKGIIQTLDKKEQVIIFLNRRGYSFFVQCKECNFIFKCKSCSVSLTLHKNNWLYCHYCGLMAQLPKNCLQCKSNEEFVKKGIGTEQVVTILEQMFPNNGIARADLDSTKNKKRWNEILKNFKEGEIDILVGTQTITKGYHFPNVTLVGVLWADLNLHFPVYNASEITLQQLIQVAGRAGRQIKKGKVIIQTMIEHKIFDYINEIDYLKFYNKEKLERKESKYPPYIRFAEIELKHSNELIVEKEAYVLSNELLLNNETRNVQILGPVKPIISKLKNKYFQKIYFKSKDINNIIYLVQSIDKKKYKSKIFFTPNPV